jgi:hypothetical protein
MTLTFMRPAIALAIALGLAGCGGKASFPIKGTVQGLSYDGLVLSTNGMDLAVAKNTTTFSFPNSLSYGDVYDVKIVGLEHQPEHQTCVVHNGADTAGRLTSIDIVVQCALNQYTIGGKIVGGLTSAGLELTNGSAGGKATVAANATTFTFANTVPFSVSYGVTVLTQPEKEICSVTNNGTGVMGDKLIDNIEVTCVPKPAPAPA